MTDVLSPEQRHKCMSKVKNKNTRPEMVVRKYLFSKGFRYRLHDKKLPGKPDIVLPKYNCVIFVNGCFWHGHECAKARLPKTNKEFWQKKISSNIAHDNEILCKLQRLGYTTLIVWQCELTSKRREQTLENLVAKIYEAGNNCTEESVYDAYGHRN